MAARSSLIGPVAVLCLLLILFLVAATIVLALIPIYLPTKGLDSTFREPGTRLTVGYASSARNGGSYTVSNPSSVGSQIGNQLGTSNNLAITGARFLPTQAATRRKRQSLTSDGKISCEVSTGLTGDILVLPTELAYPVDCRGLCRNRYRNNALKKLRKDYERFTITVTFTVIGSREVTLVFCGIFDSDSIGCTTQSRNYAYLMDLSNVLYQFNPTSLVLIEIGSANCSSSSSLYSIALQRNGILWTAYADGSLYKYNLISKTCAPTSFVGNQTGFAPFTITFLKSSTDDSETLYASRQSNNNTALAKIDTETFTLTTVGVYNNGLDKNSDNAGLNDGRLFGIFDAKPYTIAQIDPTNANILAQYPLNRSSTNNDPNYGFTVFKTRFFFFEGNGTYSDLLTYDLSSNTTTLQYSIPQVIFGATSSSCLGT